MAQDRNETRDETAYTLGCLMARIEAAGVPGAAQKHLLASEQPAKQFPPLIEAAARRLSPRAAQEFRDVVPARLPEMLTGEHLGEFELGYWHEKARLAGETPRRGRPPISDEPRAFLSLRLPRSLIEQIDRRVPRNTRTAWIEQAIRDRLDRNA